MLIPEENEKDLEDIPDNVKSELEIAHLHEKMDRLTSEVLARLGKIEKTTASLKPAPAPTRPT